MDPWADSSAAWSPQEAVHPRSPRPIPDDSSTYAAGPVDPWAEPSSSTIPSISTQRRQSNESQEYPREARSNSVGDFDPWGGNSAPVAPLSTAFHSGNSDERDSPSPEENAPKARWTGEETMQEEQVHSQIIAEEGHRGHTPEEREVESATVDDDDPWGSGAAARRIKLQQEAESVSQQCSISVI